MTPEWTDKAVVDAIALCLGTAEEWQPHHLDVVAELVGYVRPHPGDIPHDEYEQALREAM